MKRLLEKYVKTQIGLNCEKLMKITPVFLCGVEEDYFYVENSSGLIYYYPYTGIITILQDDKGIKFRGIFFKKKYFKIIIKVRQSTYGLIVT